MKKAGRRTYAAAALLLAAVVVVPLCAAGTGGGEQHAWMTPDPDVQDVLKAMADPEATDMAARLETLRPYAAKDGPALVRQLFLFGLQARSTRAGMLPGAVIEALALSHRDLAVGLVPLLGADDPGVRDKARNWLGQVEIQEGGRTLDFSVYAAVLRAGAPGDPSALIRYLVERDASAARVVLEEVYGPERAEDLVREALEKGVGGPGRNP